MRQAQRHMKHLPRAAVTHSEYSHGVLGVLTVGTFDTPMGYSAHEAPAVCAAASPCGGALVSFTASPVGGGGAEAPAGGYSEYSQWGLGFRVLSLGGRLRAGSCVHARASVRGCAAAGFPQECARVRAGAFPCARIRPRM